MKALVYHGPRAMSWDEWSDPAPGPGELVVATRAVGVCGSDLHGYTGESGRRKPPMVMGHEVTGQVIAVGAQVDESWLGRRVVVQPILFCGACDECRAGRVNRCRHRRFVGGNTDGAMADKLAVPVTNVLPLDPSISFVDATLTEPLSVALHAVEQAGNLGGKSVLVAGSGPIGLLTLVAAKRAGARVVALTEPVAARRAVAKALGADAALDPSVESWKAELASVAGSAEVDVAFDAVGIAPTIGQALECVVPGGTVIALGGWRTVPVDFPRLVAREVMVRGTFNFVPSEFERALGWLQDRRVDPALLITDRVPMAEGASVFERLTANPANSLKVVLTQEGEHP